MVGFAVCAEGGIASSRMYSKLNSSSCLQKSEDAIDSCMLFWDIFTLVMKPPLSRGRRCQAGLEQLPRRTK